LPRKLLWKILAIRWCRKPAPLYRQPVWHTTWETLPSVIQVNLPYQDSFTKGQAGNLKPTFHLPSGATLSGFDGNANAFRILTHQFNGKRTGGFALTYPTLASIVKYPFESPLATKQKFGFFQSEKEDFLKIASELEIPAGDGTHLSYKRYPLVYLVEAADDICYQMMDLEDACKLGILSYERVQDLYLNFYDPVSDKPSLDSIRNTLGRVTDRNEQISFLRAGVIGKLIHESIKVFEENQEAIMKGSFSKSLIGSLQHHHAAAMQLVKEVSWKEVYAHRSVVEIEIAGYKIIGTLLEEFVGAAVNPDDRYNKKILSLLPDQYQPQSDSLYHRIQSAVDFISGMTDVFALDLYRKIKGISLPGLKSV
jgi:dGTPase